jgi:hypothetical protein
MGCYNLVMMSFEALTDEAFNAYLAGFTDGEGYIGIDYSGSIVRIITANCVPEVLEAIRSRLGYGHIKSQQLRPHWRRRYTFDASNTRDCWDYLHRIQPYARIKAALVEVGIAKIADRYAELERRRMRNEAILAALDAGETQEVVGRRFGVRQSTVSLIKCGKRGQPRRGTLLPITHPSTSECAPPTTAPRSL